MVYLPLWKILVSWDHYSQLYGNMSYSKPPTRLYVHYICIIYYIWLRNLRPLRNDSPNPSSVIMVTSYGDIIVQPELYSLNIHQVVDFPGTVAKSSANPMIFRWTSDEMTIQIRKNRWSMIWIDMISIDIPWISWYACLSPWKSPFHMARPPTHRRRPWRVACGWTRNSVWTLSGVATSPKPGCQLRCHKDQDKKAREMEL